MCMEMERILESFFFSFSFLRPFSYHLSLTLDRSGKTGNSFFHGEGVDRVAWGNLSLLFFVVSVRVRTTLMNSLFFPLSHALLWVLSHSVRAFLSIIGRGGVNDDQTRRTGI